jgi:hypothetical protein
METSTVLKSGDERSMLQRIHTINKLHDVQRDATNFESSDLIDNEKMTIFQIFILGPI